MNTVFRALITVFYINISYSFSFVQLLKNSFRIPLSVPFQNNPTACLCAESAFGTSPLWLTSLSLA